MSNELKFINEISTFNYKVKLNCDATVQETLAQAGEFVLGASPVDSGTFAASWNISNGAPDVRITEGWNEDLSLGAFLENRSSRFIPSFVQAKMRNRAAALTSGGIAYLSNNVPYANYVERGSKTSEAQYIVRRVQTALRGWAVTSAMQAQAGPRNVT